MKFGQVTHEAQLEGKSLKLPPALFCGDIRRKNEAVAQTPLKVILGAPVWGCVGWKGKIYPSDAKPKDFLKHYSRALRAIELNSTFYGLPNEDRLQSWMDQTPDDFLFCPKVPRHISHAKDQLVKTERWVNFWKRLAPLKGKLGRVFLQLPDTYGISDLSDLENLLKTKDASQKLAVEFRSPEFFSDGVLLPELCDLLAQWNSYPVISDTLGRRYSLHQNFVGDEVMIRFLGRENENEDLFRLNEWRLRLKEMQTHGIETVYFFLHQPDETYCAQTMSQFSRMIEEEAQLRIKPLRLLKDEALTLF